jgi:tetratricopeptide (TPR) repeat protein
LQALVATNLSNVFLKQGRLSEAETLLRQAWALRLQARDEVSLANTIGSLAEVLAMLHELAHAFRDTEAYDKASACLAEALRVAVASRKGTSQLDERLAGWFYN